jgi:hypothetical protein
VRRSLAHVRISVCTSRSRTDSGGPVVKKSFARRRWHGMGWDGMGWGEARSVGGAYVVLRVGAERVHDRVTRLKQPKDGDGCEQDVAEGHDDAKRVRLGVKWIPLRKAEATRKTVHEKDTRWV